MSLSPLERLGVICYCNIIAYISIYFSYLIAFELLYVFEYLLLGWDTNKLVLELFFLG